MVAGSSALHDEGLSPCRVRLIGMPGCSEWTSSVPTFRLVLSDTLTSSMLVGELLGGLFHLWS